MPSTRKRARDGAADPAGTSSAMAAPIAPKRSPPEYAASSLEAVVASEAPASLATSAAAAAAAASSAAAAHQAPVSPSPHAGPLEEAPQSVASNEIEAAFVGHH